MVVPSVQSPPTPAQLATNNHDIGLIELGATLAEMKQLGASLADKRPTRRLLDHGTTKILYGMTRTKWSPTSAGS